MQKQKTQQKELLDTLPIIGWSGVVKDDSRRTRTDVASFVDGVFSDGIVTQDEYTSLQTNQTQVMYDFLLAVDLYYSMQKGGYSKEALHNAWYVMVQVKVARDISYAAVYRAASYDKVGKAEIAKRKERQDKKEPIRLSLTPKEISLLRQLDKESILMTYNHDKKMLKPLTKEQLAQHQKRVQQMVDDVGQNGQSFSQIIKNYQGRENG